MKKIYKADVKQMTKVAEDLEIFFEEENLSPDIAFAFNLCIDEIFTNVASYAYEKECDSNIVELEIRKEPSLVRAYIRDYGKEFNPINDSKEPDLNASLEDRDIGGLGIFFLKKNMDELAYHRHGNQNELMFAKKVSQNA